MTPGRPHWTLLSFSVLVLVLYLAVPTSNYHPDSVGFALGIEHPEWFGNSLVQPNHLIFVPFGRAVYELVQTLGLEMRAIPVLQIVNSIAAACCVFAVGAIVLDWTGSTFISVLAAGLMAFSATWWKFSTDADAFILPTLFLTLAFRFILPWQPVRPLSVAALHSAAMLFHQLSVLFWPVAVFGIWRQTEGQLRKWLAVATYLIAAFIMTITPYMVSASRAGDLTPGRFGEWIANRPPGAHFSFGAASAAEIAESHVKLLLRGRWSQARRFQGWPTAAALAVLAACALLLARRPELTPDDAAPAWRDTRAVLLLALLWIAPFFLFLCFWFPREPFYRLLYQPAIILLLTATAVQRGWIFSAEVRKSIGLGVAAVAVWNFCLFIYPDAQTESNAALLAAGQLRSRLHRDAMVYHAALAPDSWMILYENPQTRWMELSRFDLASLNRDIAEAAGQGRDVWLNGSALDRVDQQPGGRGWLTGHTVQLFELKRGSHDIRFAQVHP